MQRGQAEHLTGKPVRFRTWDYCGEGLLKGILSAPRGEEAAVAVEVLRARREKDGSSLLTGIDLELRVGQVHIGLMDRFALSHYEHLERVSGDRLDDPSNLSKTWYVTFEGGPAMDQWLEARIAWEKRTFANRHWPSEDAWVNVVVMKCVQSAMERTPISNLEGSA